MCKENRNYASPREVILSNIKISEDGGCWEWTRALNSKGYGIVRFMGKVQQAHRISYRLLSNPSGVVEIPNGMLVCHSCDRPACVNPAHLFVGTYSDNMNDMIAKGRAGPRVGEDAGMAKISYADAKEIRRLYAEGGVSQLSLAGKYGIGQTQVGRIIRHERWLRKNGAEV